MLSKDDFKELNKLGEEFKSNLNVNFPFSTSFKKNFFKLDGFWYLIISLILLIPISSDSIFIFLIFGFPTKSDLRFI